MVSDPSGAIEETAWEYWKQKIGDNAQKYGYTNTNRIVYAVNNTSLQYPPSLELYMLLQMITALLSIMCIISLKEDIHIILVLI